MNYEVKAAKEREEANMGDRKTYAVSSDKYAFMWDLYLTK